MTTATAARQTLERSLVELGKERPDRHVELIQAEEALMMQPREDQWQRQRRRTSLGPLKQRLRRLGLYGLLAHAEELINEPWLGRVLEIEESGRLQRSLKRRTDNARLGTFKPMVDFDYEWPKELDRALLDELFTLGFIEQTANLVIVGPNGLGKSMIAQNLLHQAVLRGYTARFTAASDMLHDLAAQDSSTQLSRRLRRYTTPTLLACDEVGYLAYDTRYADLLFEIITRRYQLRRPTVLTTNRVFGEWNQVFPNAAAWSPSSIGWPIAPRSSRSMAKAIV